MIVSRPLQVASKSRVRRDTLHCRVACPIVLGPSSWASSEEFSHLESTAITQGAMLLFWQHGYRGVSIRDIAAKTGALPGSLHYRYGGKRELYLEAIRRYVQEYCETPLAELAQRPSPRKAIVGFFETAVVPSDGGLPKGCLVVNAALEMAADDRDVSEIVGDLFSLLLDTFRDLIEQGQDRGEIPAHLDPAETAHALRAKYLGLRVLARSTSDVALLRSIVISVNATLSRQEQRTN